MRDVLARIEQIFRDVLDDEALELSRETTPMNLPGWDSLAHVNVLFSVEEEFGVQFSTSEFKRLTTVGDLADALVTKGVTSEGDR
jgi:acyl carrier protein